MKYRKAELSEISQLVELRKKQLIDEGLSPIENIDIELQKFFKLNLNNGSLISYVAEESGSIVATGGVCFYQLPPAYSNPTGKMAYITNMYTKNEYRGKGIASELLNLIVDEAQKKGYKVIKLQALKQGMTVYKRFGFKEAEGHMLMQL